ncbi:MAG: glycogen debranching enzyme N-terminal domain-containing protein, partial [Elusimicrobia bacterium]|nr:glycogen debranching enzyme N-terminal domain-containing protein [Elusimicrobiota bacterium]
MKRIKKSPPVEWLLTNARGGYSSSSASGKNLRRYHSLLVSSENLVRFSLLNFLQIEPEGRGSARTVFPAVSSEISGKGFRISEKISFSIGKDSICVEFRLKSPSSCSFRVRPFFSMRRNHNLRKTVSDLQFLRSGNWLLVKSEETKCFFYPSKFFEEDRLTKKVSYEEDKIRDDDFSEIVYSPGYFHRTLKKDKMFRIYFSSRKLKNFPDFERERAKSRMNFAAKFSYRGKFFGRLLSASLDFDAGDEIVAGFPWFGAWGRDTMISVPGLLLYPGRIGKARTILEKASGHIRKGLLPNIFSTRREPACYNSADASLWFLWALSEYKKIAGFDSFLKSMKKTVIFVIENYIAGTDYGIKMDKDGLIRAFAPGFSLTWMDAVYKGRPFTPRPGKPVEIQALWINAL